MTSFKKSLLVLAAMGTLGITNANANAATVTRANHNTGHFSTTIGGQSFSFYIDLTTGALTYLVNNQAASPVKFAENLNTSVHKEIAETKVATERAAAEKEAAERAAQEAPKKKDDHVAERTRKTNATVAGAIAVNLIIDEVFGDMLHEEGAGVGASVGGQFEKPELNIGASLDLGKHLGEDFDGVSINAGVGVESGEISVGARKTWRVAEYVTTSVGASIGSQGVRVGPEIMICNGQFGIGVAMWGPIPVPQVKVFGYTASVVPHLALANAVVGGATIAYKAVRSEMKKPAAAEEIAEQEIE